MLEFEISRALKDKSFFQETESPSFFFVRAKLKAFYPVRLSIFVPLNNVSLSTMISGFLFNPSMCGANYKPFLLNDLTLKLKLSKS